MILILLVSLVIRLFNFRNYALWWDSAVYIEMGKYIFSSGNIGLFEASRPLVWPLILGFLWKIKLDPIFFGRIFMLLFSLAIICLTYLIARDVFNEKIALLASLMLSLSPTFFFFNSKLLSGIPSLFFALFGVYLFLKKKYFVSGISLGMAFMTRFVMFGVSLILGLIILYLLKKGKIKTKQISYLALGFVVPVLPFLIFNQIRYNNLLFPFILQSFMTKYTGWIYKAGFGFYFTNLIKENALIIFALSGLLLLRIKTDYKKTLLALVFLFYLAVFSFTPHKEMRFVLTFLPCLYIIVSYGLVRAFESGAKRKYFFILMLGVFWLVQESMQLFPSHPIEETDQFDIYLMKNDVKEGIWTTNPIFFVHSDKRADELIYYPLFDSQKAAELQKKLGSARHILIDTCDLECPPWDDECEDEKEKFLKAVEEDFEQEYFKIKENCRHYIFKSSS